MGAILISEDQDETHFIWQGNQLQNFLLLLDIDLWMDFGPDGQHGVEEEAPEGPLTGGQVVKTRKDLKSTSTPSRSS